jgi:uncharacterized protein (DUF2236 family)
MADRSINEDVGFFGPDSVIWRVNREAVVALAGTCAILMQLAHPKVAAGVRDHSNFQSDPAGRLRRTFDLSLAWVFGSRAEAMDAARVVNKRHDAVQGDNYSARDPELLLWVQATLVYSSVLGYRTFVGSLSDGQADAYYQATKRIGGWLGIPSSLFPPDVRALGAYIHSMIASGEVKVSEDAYRMGWVLLAPHFPGVPRMAFAPLKTVTTGLLPEPLREQYQLRWGRVDRALFAACRRAFPYLLKVTPTPIRYLPQARRAYRRLTLEGALTG